MRVFVLSTGRCGSKTFAQAASHATNFTAAHESRISDPPATRLDYPDSHVESDMRLHWFAGRLAERFPDAVYVHLLRDREATAESHLRRFADHPHPDRGTSLASKVRRRLSERWPGPRAVTGYGYFLLMPHEPWSEPDRFGVCLDYVDTVNANIRAFLSGRPM